MRRLFVIYSLFVLIFNLRSQSTVSTYSFINYNVNHLNFDKDSSTFIKFYKKLHELNQGTGKRLTIAHIGGSHVQGGMWSNAFMENLQTCFNVYGGGYFAFPYKLAKTNGQPYASGFTSGKWKKCRCVTKDFCLPLGMNGISVSTNDSSNYFGMALTKKSVIKKFNTVRVYHNFNPSFEFYSLMKAKREDRIDKGYSIFRFDEPVDSVSFSLLRCDTLVKDFTLFGFSLEDDVASGFYLAGLGANGASSHSFLRCNYFKPQLATIQPDMVIISLGVNDVQAKNFSKDEFIAHYDSLIRIIKEVNPECAILLTTTTDNYVKRKTPNKRTESAQEALFDVMRIHQVAVWDMYEVMGGYKSISKWTKTGLASRDRVHFSGKGYRILGTMMYEALYNSYQYNQKNLYK